MFVIAVIVEEGGVFVDVNVIVVKLFWFSLFLLILLFLIFLLFLLFLFFSIFLLLKCISSSNNSSYN